MSLGHARDDKTSRQGTTDTLALMEEGRSKERYDKLKDMLVKGRNVQFALANQVDNIQMAERILEEYRIMYINLYGRYPLKVPSEIESSQEYIHVNFLKIN